MDLLLLVSDPPKRHTEINLFLARSNISVSYILFIFNVGQEHEDEADRTSPSANDRSVSVGAYFEWRVF